MSTKQVPNLTMDERKELVVSLICYVDRKDRVWNFNVPRVAIAQLIDSIIKGIPCYYTSDYLTKEIKKMPMLWEKIGKYYGF